MTKATQLNLEDEAGADRRRIHLREISGDSEAPLETVGQDLRAARLRRGDEIATVSRALKIGKDHLTSLEEDNIDSLPGKTYAIGFVRSYATYLGLDTGQMVERFKQEIAGRHDEEAASVSSMHLEEQRRLPNGWRIVAGIVVLALAYGAWHLLSAGPSSQPVPPPPALAPPHVATAAPAPAPVQAPEQSAVPSPAIDHSAMPPAASASPPASALAAAPTVSQPAATPSPAVPAVPTTPSQVPGQVYGALNRDARVVLRARGDTHILVRGQDGTVYINRNLKAGDSYRLPNAVGLSLATTNAGAVEINLDGLAMGRAGSELQTNGDIDLDPQSIVDRYGRH